MLEGNFLVALERKYCQLIMLCGSVRELLAHRVSWKLSWGRLAIIFEEHSKLSSSILVWEAVSSQV